MKIKKTLALLLALVMVVCLCACNTNGEKPTEPSDKNTGMKDIEPATEKKLLPTEQIQPETSGNPERPDSPSNFDNIYEDENMSISVVNIEQDKDEEYWNETTVVLKLTNKTEEDIELDGCLVIDGKYFTNETILWTTIESGKSTVENVTIDNMYLDAYGVTEYKAVELVFNYEMGNSTEDIVTAKTNSFTINENATPASCYVDSEMTSDCAIKGYTCGYYKDGYYSVTLLYAFTNTSTEPLCIKATVTVGDTEQPSYIYTDIPAGYTYLVGQGMDDNVILAAGYDGTDYEGIYKNTTILIAVQDANWEEVGIVHN